jgi:hypothetical protein
MPKLRLKIADYLIVGSILAWGIAGFWFNVQGVDAAEQKYATIYVENKKIAEVSLAPGDRFTHTFQFGDNGEHSAVIEIENGRIRMMPLDEGLCPKAICSHTGWIAYSYESIVCLPNQIMIVFNEPSAGEDDGIDGLTF